MRLSLALKKYDKSDTSGVSVSKQQQQQATQTLTRDKDQLVSGLKRPDERTRQSGWSGIEPCGEKVATESKRLMALGEVLRAALCHQEVLKCACEAMLSHPMDVFSLIL